MRVHIIQPTHYVSPGSRRLARVKKLNLKPLTLPYLAALLPDGVEVKLTDERTQELDMTAPCDMVFLSVWTINSLRAYEIAREYRSRGVPVVMGGPHCYFHAEEARGHADAVVAGEGEYAVPEVIEDFSSGRLSEYYASERLHDLKGLPLPRRDLLDPSSFTRFHTVAVQTSRGCPNACEFCTERFYLGPKYRMRPVEEVVEEIRATGSKRIFFADSTLAAHRGRTMRLMESLIPLGIRWSALWTADRARDREFMKLARRSGLLHVNIGIESIKPETLEGMNKRTTRAEDLDEVVSTLRSLDISFSFNLIFGWDSDTLDDFRSTLEFLKDRKVHAAFFNPFTPHKGTAVYDRYLEEGRIIGHAEDLGRYPGVRAGIRPANFTAGELEEKIREMYGRFYSWPSILRRLPLPTSQSALASWAINIAQRKMYSGGANNFDDY